ncbi:MAG: hypothetical protein PF450_06280 [Bacteroidales bacterium]|jgi:hypothetical protein|nr:hypothetical protein [Bacteroidales bacterium]
MIPFAQFCIDPTPSVLVLNDDHRQLQRLAEVRDSRNQLCKFQYNVHSYDNSACAIKLFLMIVPINVMSKGFIVSFLEKFGRMNEL